MRKFFALDMPAGRFLRNTLLFSLLGLIPTLVLYVALTPGFGSLLIGGGAPLGRFLRQVLTNGLPVVFAVNYVGFFLFACASARARSFRVFPHFLVLDIVARVAVFVLLHAIVYVLSADWFGSFGGSRATAVRVVAPTLARSALFENLSGVYLYATLLSALPLYADMIGQHARSRIAGPVSGRIAACILAVAWLGLSILALTGLAVLATRLQGA